MKSEPIKSGYRRVTGGVLLIWLALLANPLPAAAEPRLIEWHELMPEGWPPSSLFEGADLDNMQDDDPAAAAFMAQIDTVWKTAPMVESLDGARIHIAGYAIPLDGDGEEYSSFLLVPYFGACIHVPPPPRNQTILVRMPEGRLARIRHAFDVLWVTGELRIETAETELAATGYALTGEVVAPYTDSLPAE